MNENSVIPGVHLAMGNFQKCINLLKTQIKLANIEGLKQLMKNIYLGSHAQFKFIPCLQNNYSLIRDSRSGKMLPNNCVRLNIIQAKLNVN